MKKYPDLEIFEDIAIELGVDPSFVEKDWFATQILIEIAKIESPEIVFAGGTSLSKGYNLIRRFSEDLDFRICTPIQLSRNDRKVIRAGIISKVNNIADVLIIHDSMRSQNESNFFSFNVEYPHIFPKPESLRPHLKLEFSFENTLMKPGHCGISSFVTQFTKAEVECRIKAVAPIETAADKFSALLWRINIRDRNADLGTTQNDPTMLRHLHDLAELFQLISDNMKDFRNAVQCSFKRDLGRGGSDKGNTLKELSIKVVNRLKSDHLYSNEYTQFVEAMSYAPENEQIKFDEAAIRLEHLISAL